jgi:ribosomal protein S18 acetylase RimI-like enzyme
MPQEKAPLAPHLRVRVRRLHRRPGAVTPQPSGGAYGRGVLERSYGLTAAARSAIADLEARCTRADGGRLKLEWGALGRRDPGEVNDLLWWSDDRQLVGFCGRYSFGGQTPEITGMVDPMHRRRGIGSALLGELLALCKECGDDDVLLVTARSCADAKALAERHGAPFDHAEHAMVLTELRGTSHADPSVSLRPATPDDVPAVRALLRSGFGGGTALAVGDGPDPEMLVAERDGRVIATLRVTDDVESRGVYGFVVDQALRGRGIGRDLLRRVCATALRDGVSTVHLEVETENDHALGLYSSVGFELQTTEDYYRFVLGPGAGVLA